MSGRATVVGLVPPLRAGSQTVTCPLVIERFLICSFRVPSRRPGDFLAVSGPPVAPDEEKALTLSWITLILLRDRRPSTVISGRSISMFWITTLSDSAVHQSRRTAAFSTLIEREALNPGGLPTVSPSSSA